jgi:iron complex transport system substrate-binding protein
MRLRIFFIWILITVNVFSYEIMEGDKAIVFEKSFHRIISLYPAHTEVILDLGGKDKLVGTVKEEGLFENTEGIERFSYSDSLEKFLALRPDLILIRPMYRQKNKNLFSRLEQMGITVVSLQPVNYNELERYWTDLSLLIGKADQGKEYLKKYQMGLESIEASNGKRKKVFFEARMQNGLYTASESSIAHFIIEKAGGDVITGDKAIMKSGKSVLAPVNMEYLLSQGKNIDVYLAQEGRMNSRSIESIKKTPGYNSIKAINSGEIYILKEASFSRPTLEILNTMREIKKILSK